MEQKAQILKVKDVTAAVSRTSNVDEPTFIDGSELTMEHADRKVWLVKVIY